MLAGVFLREVVTIHKRLWTTTLNSRGSISIGSS